MRVAAIAAVAVVALLAGVTSAPAGTRRIEHDGLRFDVEIPDTCRTVTSKSQVTFHCPPDPAEVAPADRSKTFSLAVYAEPAPADGAWLRLDGIAGETRKIIARHDICEGSDPEAARINAFIEGSGGPSNNIWGLITGAIICQGVSPLPWPKGTLIFFRQISTKRQRYWIAVRFPESIKDAAMRVADQMFFLTFEPLKD